MIAPNSINPFDPNEDVLTGRDMICFSHDWSGDPLSKTHLMRLMARDNRVLWVNSIGYRRPTASTSDLRRIFRKLAAAMTPVREVERNIFVLNPLAIPAYNNHLIRSFNKSILRYQIKRAMKKLNFKRPIDWVFNPTAAVVAGSLGEELLIYYCVDEFAAFKGVPTQSVMEMDEQMSRNADLVVVSAESLYQSKRQFNPNTRLVRHGVDVEHFRKALDNSRTIPADVAYLPKPIIGYFGLIAPDWIDLPLLIDVARRFPKASLVMLGSVKMDVSELQRLPNVHLLGRKPYETLPDYAAAFDVAIIPFPLNPATMNSNPLKAREYLAAGLPVVSTRIPEVVTLDKCAIADGADSFCDLIGQALANPGPSEARSQSMRGETWSARLDEIRRHVAAVSRN